jgi:hypothetical protein
MGVQVREWKGAWWIFVNHNRQRKAKRVGTGKEGHRAALAAAEKIQARLLLGDLSLPNTHTRVGGTCESRSSVQETRC